MHFPQYSLPERIADACVHAVGVAASTVATAVLMAVSVATLPLQTTVAVAVYGAGALLSFGFSAGYNLAPPTRLKSVPRRLDHAAIFVMIAGSYTPFALVAMPGAWGYGLLAAVWAVAAAGIAMKLLLPGRFARTSVVLYLVQGWAVLAAVGPLSRATSAAVLALLAAGGIIYTLGIVFHLWRRLPFQNAIWHVMVLVAAGCHYAAVVETVIA